MRAGKASIEVFDDLIFKGRYTWVSSLSMLPQAEE
jgi:hypothetical protein